MTDDDPLDLTQVAADEAALEELRLRRERPDDAALQLMRDLLDDVERDLPPPVPQGQGSTVLRLASESSSDSRMTRGGTVVALLAAGVVAFGGVAAASSALPPGNPLHGFGEGVRAAASAVVDAVKPPETAPRADPAAGTLPGPAADRATEAVTSRPSPASGPATANAARSVAAARQVAALLDEAEQLLAADRVSAAAQRLDVAERRLSDVSDDAAPELRARLADLRAQVDAALSAQRPGPVATEPGPKSKAEPKDGRPSQGKPARSQGPRTDAEPEPQGGPGQPSRAASTKPRA